MSTPAPIFTDPMTEQMLHQFDLYAEPPSAGNAVVRDVDGNLQFRVPITIDPFSLVSIVDHGKRQHEFGRQMGREHVKRELLTLIGAQPATT